MNKLSYFQSDILYYVLLTKSKKIQKMKYILCLNLLLIISSCSSDVKEGLLEIPESFSFMLEQRASKVIEGNEGNIRIKIGDITKRKVEVSIKGETNEDDQEKILLEKVMSEGDRCNFDYYGTGYTIEIEDLINHLIGDDNAQIAIYKTGEDTFNPVVE